MEKCYGESKNYICRFFGPIHVHFYTELTALGIHESKRPDANLTFSTAIVPSTVSSPIKTLICDTKAVQIPQADYNNHHDTFVFLLHQQIKKLFGSSEYCCE